MASPTDENVQLNHAPPAPTDGVTTKRQRLQTNEAPPTAIGRVLDVEMLLRGLLTLLDLASLASFLEVVAADESWRGILTNEELWGEMLSTHFGGGLPAVEQFNDGRIVEEEEEEDDDEEEEGEDLPMDQEEEEEEPDLIELLEGEMDVEDADSDVENEDDEEEVVIVPPPLQRPRAGRSARRVAAVAAEAEADAAREGSQGLSVNWIEGVPSQKVLDLACADLNDFLRSAEQLVQFNARLQIIRGDIGEIERVGEQRIDGLAFPTAPGLRNPHTGAAAVIHNRAGQGMTAHVRTWNGYLGLGDAHVTPGFDAGVDKLIHCVGPTGLTRDCLKELQRTYRSVLRCIQHENLSCVAMASISTGNNGLPVDSASWFALCAIQRYMRSTPNWTATIGIVCFEADAYKAFTKSKFKLLAQFNADCVRANPPLRLR
ncbi:hypothetical protein PF008_g14161 [Phytophthora fragariae]|uniref:Macro domain-containing protein n=1 Tax=Phytophthora fragariae TaxID=53985 RepID=A0A6G0RHY5_9STRA|nr:hypothetical protein PF008_g14161 [Phytophthora fragariae]